MRAQWEAEKGHRHQVRSLREQIEKIRSRSRRPSASTTSNRACAELHGEAARSEAASSRPKTGRAATEAEGRAPSACSRGGHRGGDRRDRLALDRHPGHPPGRGRAREAAATRRDPARACDRPGRGGELVCRRRHSGPGRHQGPEAPDRLLHLPGPDRRRQDRARQDARRRRSSTAKRTSCAST